MSYLIEGLDPVQFAPLFQLSDAELAEKGIRAGVAVEGAAPCRVSLCEAAEGDRLLLLNYLHQPASSPYRSRHAIYVAQGSAEPGVYRGSVPPIMQTRILSIRAFDADDMIIDADVVDGLEGEPVIERLLAIPETAYLHVHFAKRGCFAGTVRRLED